MRRRMEVAAAKTEWITREGKLGYFAGLLDHGIDWKSEISAIASIDQPWAEAVTYCCIPTKPVFNTYQAIRPKNLQKPQ